MPYTYTKVPADAFQHIQINAGILTTEFDPESTEELDRSKILGTTSGGIEFNTNTEYSDFGEDMDNVPNNTKQLKRILYYNPVFSGTFVSENARLVQKLVAAADYGIDSESGVNVIKPRTELYYGSATSETADDPNIPDDFFDIWFIGDYSQFNSGTEGGCIAIHMRNALSTGGLAIQTSKDEKGTFDFEFTGHYDIKDLEVPFEVYIRQPAAADITPSYQVSVTSTKLQVPDANGNTSLAPSTARAYVVSNGNKVFDIARTGAQFSVNDEDSSSIVVFTVGGGGLITAKKAGSARVCAIVDGQTVLSRYITVYPADEVKSNAKENTFADEEEAEDTANTTTTEA